MNLRGQVFRGAAVIGSGQAVSQILSLVRNMIVARLLGPADFGIAATFALTVSLLEMISDLGTDKLIIQAKDGDDPRLQATAHLWQLARELGSALLLLGLAWPMATLFQVPDARWAFCSLALVPLLRGWMHLDMKRLQRDMHFGPQVWCELGPQIVAGVVAWPLAWWLRDYSAMLWIVIVQSATFVLLSHLGAQRRYRLGYEAAQFRRLLVFGWPLWVNGLLMFAIFQGDRAVVGAWYSMRDLGLYAAALALAMAPVQLLVAIAGGVALPLLSRVQSDAIEFERRYTLCVTGLAVAAGSLAILFIVAGPQLLSATFGAAFGGAGLCVMVLAGAQSLRLLRAGTTIAALARGDTANSMWSNVWRMAGFAAAMTAALVGAPISWIAAAALFGEVLALGYSLGRLARRHDLSVMLCLRPSLAALPCVAGAALLRSSSIAGNVGGSILAATVLVGIFGFLVLLVSPALRRQVTGLLPARAVAVIVD